jgi:hypothetical protein
MQGSLSQHTVSQSTEKQDASCPLTDAPALLSYRPIQLVGLVILAVFFHSFFLFSSGSHIAMGFLDISRHSHHAVIAVFADTNFLRSATETRYSHRWI